MYMCTCAYIICVIRYTLYAIINIFAYIHALLTYNCYEIIITLLYKNTTCIICV